MKAPGTGFTSIEQYIGTFPEHVQARLREADEIIRQAAPEAEGVISYNIPAYKQGSVAIYYSAYKAHLSLSFYPTELVYEQFKEELKPYKKSKSTVQFPYKDLLPKKLITDIVKFKLLELA